jgi:hypothetical protein
VIAVWNVEASVELVEGCVSGDALASVQGRETGCDLVAHLGETRPVKLFAFLEEPQGFADHVTGRVIAAALNAVLDQAFVLGCEMDVHMVCSLPDLAGASR